MSGDLNAGYVGALLEQYLENPEAVDPAWRTVFEEAEDGVLSALPGLSRLIATRSEGGNGSAGVVQAPPPPQEHPVVEEPASPHAAAEAAGDGDDLLAAVAAAMALVKAIRMHGHLAAHLDPLGSEPPGDPALEPAGLHPPLTPEVQAKIPARLLRLSVEGETLLDALPRLQEVYMGTIAYEIEHISDHAERVWLRRAIESGRFRQPLAVEDRRALLVRLAQVEAFETFLRRAFIGQKQFSIEGLDALVPMLDEAIELAAAAGAHEVVIGIAHRGRLNVLAHTVGRSYASILREFEGERTFDALVSDPEGGTGDVKYHLAASETRQTRSGDLQVTLAANPSHLEAVDPVIEGLARAANRPLGRRRYPRPVDRASDPDPRRRVVRRTGSRRGDLQPPLDRRLLDRWHAPRHRQQPDRLHHRSRRRPLDALLERSRQGLRRSHRPRERG